MPFWQLHYHFVWATKERVPIIEPDAEAKKGYRHVFTFTGDTVSEVRQPVQ